MERKVGKTALYYRIFKGLVITIVVSLFLSFGFLAVEANSIFLIVALCIFLLVSVIMIVEYLNLRYKIEPNSIMLRQGIFSLQTTTVPYIRITNATLNQSFFQRLFSVGTFVIDQEDSEFAWKDVDNQTANQLMQEISSKSNIQPISKTENK